MVGVMRITCQVFAPTSVSVLLPLLLNRLVTCCRIVLPLCRDLAKWDWLLLLRWRASSAIPASKITTPTGLKRNANTNNSIHGYGNVTFWQRTRPGLTVCPAVVTAALPVGLREVFEG